MYHFVLSSMPLSNPLKLLAGTRTSPGFLVNILKDTGFATFLEDIASTTPALTFDVMLPSIKRASLKTYMDKEKRQVI